MKKILALLLCALILAGCAAPVTPSTQPAPGNESSFSVHYIDVGQADCALVECDGKYMLIDGGNAEDSSLVVSYLQKQGVEELEAVVCSHAHEDHVGGLPGVLAVFPTKAVYSPTKTYSSKVFDKFLYYTDQQGLEVTIPSPGDQFQLGDAIVMVLGPVKSYADPNNTSIVLMIDFHGKRFLFTGDMETDAENDMLDYWGEHFTWSADVLKVGHHGSDTSTSYRFLRAVMPAYGIISVGEGNSYGHPNETPLSRLEDAEVTVLRTDKLGSIIVTTDGKDITLSWERTSHQPDTPPSDGPQEFVGNKNSKTLHLPTCSTLPKEENRVIFDNYDTAIAQGYKPCSRCME
jgi:competence protein ComEC